MMKKKFIKIQKVNKKKFIKINKPTKIWSQITIRLNK